MALFVGFVLRFYGLNWGIPEREALWPDEWDYVISKALKLSWQHPDSGFYNYPQFLASLSALVFGGLKQVLAWFGRELPDYAMTLIGRTISALSGWLTILAGWWLARGLRAGKLGAGLAALFVAILPLNVWDSHVATTDIIMGFWCVMAVASAVWFLQKRGTWKTALVMGACLGLATASKYTAAIVVVALIAAVCLLPERPYPWKRAAGFLLVAGVVSLLVCFVAIPFSFIHVDKVLDAMAFERAHTARGHNGFDLFAPGFLYKKYIYQAFAAWPFSLGIALCILAYVGALGMLLRPTRERFVVWIFFAVFWGILGSWTFVPIRYYMPLTTILAVFAGIWLGERVEEGRTRISRMLFSGVGMAVLIYTLLFTWSTMVRYPRDTRLEAAHWLDSLEDHPPVCIVGWERYSAMGTRGRFSILREGLLQKRLREGPADEWLQVTSLHYLRWARAGHHLEGIYSRVENPNQFECVARFERGYLNQRFYAWLDPMYASYFIAPTLAFYARIPLPVAEPATE